MHTVKKLLISSNSYQARYTRCGILFEWLGRWKITAQNLPHLLRHKTPLTFFCA